MHRDQCVHVVMQAFAQKSVQCKIGSLQHSTAQPQSSLLACRKCQHVLSRKLSTILVLQPAWRKKEFPVNSAVRRYVHAVTGSHRQLSAEMDKRHVVGRYLTRPKPPSWPLSICQRLSLHLCIMTLRILFRYATLCRSC